MSLKQSIQELSDLPRTHSLIQEFIKTDTGQDFESTKNPELFKSAGFDMRPELSRRFRSTTIQNIINKVLNDTLYGQTYSEETAEELTKTLANTIRKQLEGEVYERYKLVVNVVLGGRKGEGVKVGARCLWDPETDSYASDSFINGEKVLEETSKGENCVKDESCC